MCTFPEWKLQLTAQKLPGSFWWNKLLLFFNVSERVDQITEVLKNRLVFCHLQMQIQCVQAYRKANKLLPIPLKLEKVGGKKI